MTGRGIRTTEFWAGLALPTVMVLLSHRLDLDPGLVKEWLWIPLAYVAGRSGVKMMLQRRSDPWGYGSTGEYDVRA